MSLCWIVSILLMIASGVYASTDQNSVVTSQPNNGDLDVVIVVSPQDTLSIAGSTVLFPCVACVGYSDSESVEISWQKGEQLIENIPNKFILHEQTVMNKSGLIFVKSVLEIYELEPIDAGNYSCMVTSVEGGGSDTALFELTTYTVPAQMIVAPVNENLTSSNTTIILTCVALGYHHSTITWSRNNAEMTSEQSNSTMFMKGGVLFIQSTLEICMEAMTIGDYKCTASNTYTTTNATFTLQANVPPHILTPPRDHVITIGESHNFTCDIVGFPHPSVIWLKDGLTVGINGHIYIHTSIVQSGGLQFVRSILTVHHMKLAMDGGYTCMAENSHGQASNGFHISAQILKMIIAPDDVLMLKSRETLALSCVVHGFPPPTLYWTIGGNILSNNNRVTTVSNEVETRDDVILHKSVLEICSSQEADSGEYSCVADNGFLTESSHFDICIHNPVGILLIPSNIMEFMLGATFILPCVGYSLVGVPRIIWTAGGRSITQLNNSQVSVYEEQIQWQGGMIVLKSILVLSCVQPEDINEYECFITNGQDISSASFQINLPGATTEPTKKSTGFTSLGTDSEIGLKPVPFTGLGHGSYVGGLISIVFMLPVIVLCLVFRKLPFAVPLVNLCIALIALNLSIVASYTSRAKEGTENVACDVLAFLFHYVFLVAVLAMTNVVIRCIYTTPKIYLQAIALCINWGLPLIIVICTFAPDQSNYTSELYMICGPSRWALWFGLVLPFVLSHIITWFLLVMITLRLFRTLRTNDRERQQNLKNLYQFMVLLFVFDFTWGVGLPAMYTPGTLQIILQILFLITSILLGVLIFLLFGLLPGDTGGKLCHIFHREMVNSEQTQPTTMPCHNDTSASIIEDIEAQNQTNIQDVQPANSPQDNPPPTKRLRISSLTTMSDDSMSLASPGVQTKMIELNEIVSVCPHKAIPVNESCNKQTVTAVKKRYEDLEKSEIISASFSL